MKKTKTLFATEIKFRLLNRLLIIVTKKIMCKDKILVKSLVKKKYKNKNKNIKSMKTIKNMK